MHTADTIAQSARMGWMPFYPQFDANPLDLADQAKAAVDAGEAPRRRRRTWPSRLADGTLQPSIADVDAPENWPRTLTLWRSNLMGSSAKGNEYFLKYLLGTHSQRDGHRGRRGRPAEGRDLAGGARRRASSTCCCRPTSG